jgi:hypothetical protein
MENEVKDLDFIKEQENLSEKYIYHFDYPHLSESGYVESNSSNIIIRFPEKKNLSLSPEVEVFHKISLYINKQLHFSCDWLPIYSYYDLLRVKDMFTKAYYDFMSLINIPISKLYNKYCPYYCSEIATEQKTEFYDIYCLHSKNNTCFDVSIKNKKNLETKYENNFINLQLYIGQNLIFCGKRDFLTYDIPINNVYQIIKLFLLTLVQI